MNVETVENIRRAHQQSISRRTDSPYPCAACQQPWPCDAVRLLDDRDRLLALVREREEERDAALEHLRPYDEAARAHRLTEADLVASRDEDYQHSLSREASLALNAREQRVRAEAAESRAHQLRAALEIIGFRIDDIVTECALNGDPPERVLAVVKNIAIEARGHVRAALAEKENAQ